jgi:DMSO/TMAO reductase YedYZ molybdopterin-dependent catalytic subunit
MSDYEKRSDEKNIGRRTFLGLLAAGVVAFFAGKDVIPRLVSSGSSPVTTTLSGGPSGGSTTTTEAESPTAGFRINSVEKGPAFDSAAWRLTVGGLVGAPLTLTFADFIALPQTTVVRDFYCVEGWGVTDVEWQGVLVSELVQRATVDPTATHLIFHSGDGVYTDSLTLEQAAAEDVLLAHRVNGVELPPDMGQPLRLICPGRYAYKNVKWVERVEAVDIEQTPFEGYWEARGYPTDADIPGE